MGRDDQFYDLEAGRAGWLRVRGWFSGVPHRYANDARSCCSTAATSLRLPPPLIPGGSSLTDIQSALDARGQDKVEVQRDRSQLSVRLRATPTLWVNAQYGLESRRGDRPYGVGISFPISPRSSAAHSKCPSRSAIARTRCARASSGEARTFS